MSQYLDLTIHLYIDNTSEKLSHQHGYNNQHSDYD